jgi:hypothetical protein
MVGNYDMHPFNGVRVVPLPSSILHPERCIDQPWMSHVHVHVQSLSTGTLDICNLGDAHNFAVHSV